MDAVASAADIAKQWFPIMEKAMNRLTLDTDKQVFFYEQDHYYLSNFSAFTLVWKNRTFPTVEHAYHWEKFQNCIDFLDGRYIADQIAQAPSAHVAFKWAQDNKQFLAGSDWDQRKVSNMRDMLRAKVSQHEYPRRKLLETGDREIVENSWRDDYWGWGPNRDGQNMLGKLWMEVREELRNQTVAAYIRLKLKPEDVK